MNDTPTPETDESILGGIDSAIARQGQQLVFADFARRLERERDSAIAVRDYFIEQTKEICEAFQPGGKYYEESNLRLGSSTIAEGFKWLSKRHDAWRDCARELYGIISRMSVSCYTMEHHKHEYHQPTSISKKPCPVMEKAIDSLETFARLQNEHTL